MRLRSSIRVFMLPFATRVGLISRCDVQNTSIVFPRTTPIEFNFCASSRRITALFVARKNLECLKHLGDPYFLTSRPWRLNIIRKIPSDCVSTVWASGWGIDRERAIFANMGLRFFDNIKRNTRAKTIFGHGRWIIRSIYFCGIGLKAYKSAAMQCLCK